MWHSTRIFQIFLLSAMMVASGAMFAQADEFGKRFADKPPIALIDRPHDTGVMAQQNDAARMQMIEPAAGEPLILAPPTSTPTADQPKPTTVQQGGGAGMVKPLVTP